MIGCCVLQYFLNIFAKNLAKYLQLNCFSTIIGAKPQKEENRVKKVIILFLLCCVMIACAVLVIQERATAPVYDIPAPTTPIPTEAPTEPEETEQPTEPIVETKPVIEETVPEETTAEELEEESEDKLLSNTPPVEEVILVVNEIAPYSETDYPDDGQIVYATHWINVRSEPSTKGDIIGKIEEEERVFRFETSNGWSKIWYKNEIGYISNQYLGSAHIETFDLYEDVDEVVYAGHDVNIRIVPSSNAPAVGKLKQGESVRRIGIGQNGWSQVIYKNQLFFINSLYLDTDPNFQIPLEWFKSQEASQPTEAAETIETEPIS